MSASTASACFFASSWLSASSAARCRRVTVACGAAALAGAADFGDFAAALGTAGAFLSAMADRLAVAVGLHDDGITLFAAGQAFLAILPAWYGTFQRPRVWHGGKVRPFDGDPGKRGE